MTEIHMENQPAAPPNRQRALKTNDQQFEAMTEYMEQHPMFAAGRLKVSDGRTTMEKMWQNLSDKLNALGPPIKPPEKWKKVQVK